jgi:hypothetical protein
MCNSVCKGVACSASYGDHFHSHIHKNADGTPVRVRVTGKCKTWKTRPDEFRLPFKYGLYQYGYIDEVNKDEWFVGYGCE